MKLDGISVNYKFNEKEKSTNYEVILKMKEPDVYFPLDFVSHESDWSGNIEDVIKSIKSSIPMLVECVNNFASKKHAEFLREFHGVERYNEHIKWFPENECE